MVCNIILVAPFPWSHVYMLPHKQYQKYTNNIHNIYMYICIHLVYKITSYCFATNTPSVINSEGPIELGQRKWSMERGGAQPLRY